MISSQKNSAEYCNNMGSPFLLYYQKNHTWTRVAHRPHALLVFGISDRKLVYYFCLVAAFIYKDDFAATVWAVIPI
jgi:hypothetical protein